MKSYLAAIWRCRFFWLSLVKMDLRTRYRRSILGLGWSLLHPIAMTIILTAVFYNLFGIGDIGEYAPFVLAGLATWNYIVTATSQGCQCFFQGESYIRQYPAPLAIYPLRTALGGTVHFLLALIVVIALAWYFKGFANLPYLVWLVPNVFLLFIFAWSIATLAGIANVHFQDTQHLTEVGFQMLFYATPILYNKERLNLDFLKGVLDFNPLASLLQLIRDPILTSQAPSGGTYAVACTTVLIAFLAAARMLTRQQKRLIFHL